MISLGRGTRPTVRVEPAPSALRIVAAAGVLLSAVWYAYTLAYFWLQPRGYTYSGSVLSFVFRIPSPSSGVTRTFAWMWRADLAQAVQVYPLGPLLFLVALLLTAYVLFIVVSGRALRVTLPPGWGRVILVVVGALLAANWAAKIFWLGV
ncbi:MAG: DUF2752 domain-containing protein [Candidatus Dormiibacterota bacterium]